MRRDKKRNNKFKHAIDGEMSMNKKLINTKEMAAMLGLSRQTLERDRFLRPNNPLYPFIRVGERAVRYDQEAVFAALQNQANNGNNK